MVALFEGQPFVNGTAPEVGAKITITRKLKDF
jgi:hypothetical protein